MANTNPTGNNAVEAPGRDHVVVFPFMAKGHTLPLLHFVTALSNYRSLRITLLTTPANLVFARCHVPPSVDVVALPFPSLPQLPPGVECTDALPSPSFYPAFLRATALLRGPFAEFLTALPSRPLVLISDFFLGFTYHVARDAGVRRLVFHGMSVFSLAVCKALTLDPIVQAEVRSGSIVHLPTMSERVKLAPEEIPEEVANIANLDNPVVRFLVDEVFESDVRSWGVLVNSFATLDGDYVALLESFYGPSARAWLVGPLFLAADESPEMEEDPENCLAWLDERAAKPGSVVYVAFGTQAHVSDAQLDELAHGLVRSGHPFLWAVRSDTWAPSIGVEPNGKIVRRWVPQRGVLAHHAVGGFVSHSGWNSVLESLAAGVPMLTWPMIAEQALNAKHVVELVGAGIRMPLKAPAAIAGRAEIAEMVQELMGGEAGQKVRDRAKCMQQVARAAVSEGGTSRLALQQLIDELQGS